MFAAIHADPSPYTRAERQAWCPQPPGGVEWEAKLAKQYVAVAVGPYGDLHTEQEKNPQLMGMMTMTSEGYLDLAFLLPNARGKGHLRRLLSMIRAQASELDLPALTTHASLAAQTPFGALGFELVKQEVVTRHGQSLRRAEMRLPLKTTGRDRQFR